ncbi:unnamed protein product [Rotaria socialis]|uniref:Uncharacterized protein n=2 Tax=Rotaria socialis TaxID=392032 RepID=A0A821Q4A0_9BILA|nr:unnamed protein product [Rotaria socialis]
MNTFDLYNLNDDVLFKSNDSFFEFVKEVCGDIEADILRVQGIRNARCLIRSTNLLDILKLDCDEVNEIKSYACFRCKGGEFIVKQGVKLNLDNLFDALKEKHDKYKKKNVQQRRKQELPIEVSAPTATNTNDSNDSNTYNSELGTTSTNSSTILYDASSINSSSFTWKHTSIDDHIIFIKDLIEKFSRKTFISVILKQNEHYELLIKSDDEAFKAFIKCQCGTRLMLPMRSDKSKFVLSNFYAHLTTSTCSMVKHIFKEEGRLANKEVPTQSMANNVPQSSSTTFNDTSNDSGKQEKRKYRDDSSTTYSTSTTNMNNDICHEISKIKSDNFFNLIEEMTSEIEVEILQAQGINNVLSLLRSQDLFHIFQIDCEELQDLRNRACLRLNNGEYMIRPAIKENLDYCINILKRKLHEQQPHILDGQKQKQDSNKEPDFFVNTFINNISENMNRSKYRYQYSAPTRRFASSVYTLGGRNVYQLLRLNLPGAFPSIPTLESYNKEYCTRIEEGDFRFDELSSYLNKINCSYAYISEDCTGVIGKIQYDVASNSFIGFCPELNNGVPMLRQYQTDDLLLLEEWYDTLKKSSLVNMHTVQPITTKGSPPFLLSSFGTDNKIDAISILFRWLYIYEKCKTNKIIIVGFSTDADPKYLRAMRLATGYFAQLPNIDLLNKDNIFEIQIPNSWSWFFLRKKQLFL